MLILHHSNDVMLHFAILCRNSLSFLVALQHLGRVLGSKQNPLQGVPVCLVYFVHSFEVWQCSHRNKHIKTIRLPNIHPVYFAAIETKLFLCIVLQILLDTSKSYWISLETGCSFWRQS